MGLCASQPRLDVQILDSDLEKLLTRLEVSQKDQIELIRFFTTIDRERAGSLSYENFTHFFKLPSSSAEFASRVFAAFNSSNSGRIDFREFVTGLWNYCTFTHANLVAFAFRVADEDGDGQLSLDELDRLTRLVYGRNQSAGAKSLTAKLRNLDPNRGIGLEQFVIFNKQYPQLLLPAFTIQTRLRDKTFGGSYWNRMSKRREAKFGNQDIKDVLQEQYDEAARESQAERQGRRRRSSLADMVRVEELPPREGTLVDQALEDLGTAAGHVRDKAAEVAADLAADARAAAADVAANPTVQEAGRRVRRMSMTALEGASAAYRLGADKAGDLADASAPVVQRVRRLSMSAATSAATGARRLSLAARRGSFGSGIPGQSPVGGDQAAIAAAAVAAAVAAGVISKEEAAPDPDAPSREVIEEHGERRRSRRRSSKTAPEPPPQPDAAPTPDPSLARRRSSFSELSHVPASPPAAAVVPYQAPAAAAQQQPRPRRRSSVNLSQRRDMPVTAAPRRRQSSAASKKVVAGAAAARPGRRRSSVSIKAR